MTGFADDEVTQSNASANVSGRPTRGKPIECSYGSAISASIWLAPE